MTETQVSNAPVLSFAERDRRWALLTDLMAAKGIDVLLVGSFRSKELVDSYVIDDYVEGMTLFAPGGDPTALAWTGQRISRARKSQERGSELWTQDYRIGSSGKDAADVVREKVSSPKRVGVVGLEYFAPGEATGYVPATFWLEFAASLPGVEFVEMSWDFCLAMMVKSEEELSLLRYAAEVAEKACAAMAATAGVGVGEEQIYAEVMREIFASGCSARYPTLLLHSGPSNLSWGPPRWVTRAERPRRLEVGDMVQAEIFPTYGGLEIQVQMSVSVGGMSPENQRLAEAARQSYEAGLAALRPGITLGELTAAMEQPHLEKGYFALTPLVHSLNPGSWVGFSRANRELLPKFPAVTSGPPAALLSAPELVIKPGMSFAFEPNACLGEHRVNIGGTVLVTETGCEELNQIATRVNYADH